jgi:hypothetical protein
MTATHLHVISKGEPPLSIGREEIRRFEIPADHRLVVEMTNKKIELGCENMQALRKMLRLFLD